MMPIPRVHLHERDRRRLLCTVPRRIESTTICERSEWHLVCALFACSLYLCAYCTAIMPVLLLTFNLLILCLQHVDTPTSDIIITDVHGKLE